MLEWVPDLGKFAVFIWSSYLIVLISICGLLGWLIVDGWVQMRKLAALEARGVRRRSQHTDA